MTTLLDRLRGGNIRSIGRSNAVAAQVLADPKRLPELIEGLSLDNAVARVRAADALEKVCARQPSLLQPHRRRLLEATGRAQQPAVRWHLAQMLGRLTLTARQARWTADMLQDWLARDASRIVRVMALQALVDLAARHPELTVRAMQSLRRAMASAHPSVRARARRLRRTFQHFRGARPSPRRR